MWVGGRRSIFGSFAQNRKRHEKTIATQSLFVTRGSDLELVWKHLVSKKTNRVVPNILGHVSFYGNWILCFLKNQEGELVIKYKKTRNWVPNTYIQLFL